MVHNVFTKSMNTYMSLTMTKGKLNFYLAERASGGQGNEYA